MTEEQEQRQSCRTTVITSDIGYKTETIKLWRQINNEPPYQELISAIFADGKLKGIGKYHYKIQQTTIEKF